MKNKILQFTHSYRYQGSHHCSNVGPRLLGMDTVPKVMGKNKDHLKSVKYRFYCCYF